MAKIYPHKHTAEYASENDIPRAENQPTTDVCIVLPLGSTMEEKHRQCKHTTDLAENSATTLKETSIYCSGRSAEFRSATFPPLVENNENDSRPMH